MSLISLRAVAPAACLCFAALPWEKIKQGQAGDTYACACGRLWHRQDSEGVSLGDPAAPMPSGDRPPASGGGLIEASLSLAARQRDSAALPPAPMAGGLIEAIDQRLDAILAAPDLHGCLEAVCLQVLLLLDLRTGRPVFPAWQALERAVAPDKPSAVPLWDWLGEGDGAQRVMGHLRAFVAAQRLAGGDHA